LFEKKVSARKFASTKVDVFHESIDEKVMNQYDGIIESHIEKV
jgi:SP family general alpha glucoside:H+ symporter-like MFS transporter